MMANTLVAAALLLRSASALVAPRRHAVRAAPVPMAMDSFMVTRLDEIRGSFDELTARLADPDVIGDNKLLMRISKQRSSAEETVTTYDEYETVQEELAGATEMFQESGDDAELREMAREEMKDLEERSAALEKRLSLLMLPSDPNDERNVMLEIRAGTGGGEAAIWAGDLLKAYESYAGQQGWQVRTVDAATGDDGGFRHVTLEISGDAVYSKLKFESGVHRVQRVPATESQGRVHTSTATLAIMPEVDDVEVKIDPKDLVMTTARSGGAGGQNVNKVETGAANDSTSLQLEWSARARSGETIHASRTLREMIARPKISRNERRPAERGASKVGRFSLFRCPGRDGLRPHAQAHGHPHLLHPGAVPAQEQGARHAAIAHAPLRARAGEADVGDPREAAHAGRHGRAVREDPHLQLEGRAVHGPPPRPELRAGQGPLGRVRARHRGLRRHGREGEARADGQGERLGGAVVSSDAPTGAERRAARASIEAARVELNFPGARGNLDSRVPRGRPSGPSGHFSF